MVHCAPPNDTTYDDKRTQVNSPDQCHRSKIHDLFLGFNFDRCVNHFNTFPIECE